MTEAGPAYAVRPARPADAVALAAAHHLAWEQAYRGVMPDRLLDDLDEEDLVQRWRTILEVDQPDGVVAVGVAPDGEVLGFASGGPTRDEDGPTAWELYAVNIVADAYGSGLAQDLVASVVRDRPATLWVLVDNPRARAFYAKEGFVDGGDRKTHEASGCEEMRLVRRG